jgi:uncharacterized membrane protein YesL
MWFFKIEKYTKNMPIVKKSWQSWKIKFIYNEILFKINVFENSVQTVLFAEMK